MKGCDILDAGGGQNILWPLLHISRGQDPLQSPKIYAPGRNVGRRMVVASAGGGRTAVDRSRICCNRTALKAVLNVFFSLHHSNCLYLMNTKWYLL